MRDLNSFRNSQGYNPRQIQKTFKIVVVTELKISSQDYHPICEEVKYGRE